MMSAARIQVEEPQRLDNGWKMAVLPAQSDSTPRDVRESGVWIDATVPGTTAQAMGVDVEKLAHTAQRLHERDVWYYRSLSARLGDCLRFEGLATIAEIWIDERRVAVSQNMFLPLDVDLECDGDVILSVVFRSLSRHLSGVRGKRARWRTSLVENQTLRFVRTTFLGHMSGWTPPVDIVGPYRPVTLTRRGCISPRDVNLCPAYGEGAGKLDAEIRIPGCFEVPAEAQLLCAGHSAVFERDGDFLRCHLDLPAAEAWWPHTHGTPVLHKVAVRIDGVDISLGYVGFRSLEIDRSADGSRFGFVVNGKKIFARGACWTPADLVALPCDKEAYLRELRLMVEVGFNMVRVPGITFYEAPEFFEAADELGIMIWQDLQFANFDYPFSDPDFRQCAQDEVKHILRLTRAHCSLVMLCGGSEIEQQAAMMGLPQTVWKSEVVDGEFRALVHAARPDIEYIANSPSGGELPFVVNSGVGHYYGVGAYMRPLEDARRADVSFAAECLAFANVPDAMTLRSQLSIPSVHHPEWKARVPRDRGASWDFEDVREYYMNLLFGINCNALRRENPERYLSFARAAPAEVMEATYAEWRRPQSRTDGALVFLWKDLWAGAGWGIVDSTGRPKSVWYAMKRACRPVQVLLSDEGVNGLHVHALNETCSAIDAQLSLECLTLGGKNMASGERVIRLEAGSSVSLTATDLFGAFFDANYAYKFGPLRHDVVVARLRAASSTDILAEAFHFPGGQGCAQHDTGLEAELIETDEEIALAVSCRHFAQTVAIDEQHFLPLENYFHLAPGQRKLVKLRALDESAKRPEGSIAALNGLDVVHY